MTAITGSAWAPGLGYRIRWGVSDTLTLTKRSLLVWYRVPAYLFFTVIQPVIFVLLFRYVFGGAIPVNVPGGYVNYLMPGIIAQTAAFATFGTAIVLAQELKKGVIDRLKSMPIARSAVLTGRLVADTARMLVTILIIVGVGYAVGFRFLNGAGLAVAMVVLATVFGVAIACVSAFTGLAIGDEEAVQSFGLIWLFPLTFVSSAFVPISTMPGWLQAFANHQPVTYVINAMRAMALGGQLEPTLWPNLWRSLIWLAGIFIVFLPLAVRAYRRAALPRQGGAEGMSELAVESEPGVAAAANQAARGQVVYITEHGNRVAGIVPLELAAILERITSDELDQLAAAADLAGLPNAAVLMEDLADREGVLESRAEPGTGVPSGQVDAGASSPLGVTWSEKASKHFRQLDDRPIQTRIVEAVNHLAENPQPPGAKPVIGLPGVFRVRQGHWRVLYRVDHDGRTIWIEDVRHRGRIRGNHAGA